MKKHYCPMEAFAALHKRNEYPSATLCMRCVSLADEKRLQKETIFLSNVSEWKRMDINCVKAHVLGTVATYKQLLHHFAVPDKLKSTIQSNASAYRLRSNTLGYEVMKGNLESAILNQLIDMDARVVLSRLSEKGSIQTRTIKLSVFRPAEGGMDLRTGEIPSHIIIPAQKFPID